MSKLFRVLSGQNTIGLFFVLLVFCLSSVTVQAANPDDALQLSKTAAERLMSELRKNQDQLKQDPSGIYDLVQDLVLPHFDFITISRFVLGRYWRDASKEQKIRFAKAFRALLVRTYAKALLEYANAEMRFLSVSAVADDDVTVRSEAITNNGTRVPILYNMHHKKDDWKVYDVTVDGISLVTNYRSSFASEVRNKGLEAVIVEVESSK